ncbi:MAG TPA: mannitol-1-phosphate 5-dehydrogenase, partial [Lentisphaeria bacterium]|nr:mannitol-1-phosphate 5-dehydrogenase [Lentisphaeria bacterium]
MTKRAVIFGAGNIGRGFIGQLFCESGYEVVFVDVDEELMAALNRDRKYRLEAVSNAGVDSVAVGPVRAVSSRDVDAVAAAVAEADIGATAVGANALKFIVPNLAAGLARRAAAGAAPINFIICENLHGAAAHVRGLVTAAASPAALSYVQEKTGFVDTVIGRMVP